MRMFSTKSIAAAVCAAAMVFITGRAAATKDHDADINANGVAFSVFKIDKPLDGPGGGVLANFTRVQTFGARNTHWVSARVDPANPNLFVFEPRVVAANTP